MKGIIAPAQHRGFIETPRFGTCHSIGIQAR